MIPDPVKPPRKFLDQPCPHCGTPRTVLNGAWLRATRVRAGMSQRDFAKRVGFSEAYICDVEHGRRRCTPALRDSYENISSFDVQLPKGSFR